MVNTNQHPIISPNQSWRLNNRRFNRSCWWERTMARGLQVWRSHPSWKQYSIRSLYKHLHFPLKPICVSHIFLVSISLIYKINQPLQKRPKSNLHILRRTGKNKVLIVGDILPSIGSWYSYLTTLSIFTNMYFKISFILSDVVN